MVAGWQGVLGHPSPPSVWVHQTLEHPWVPVPMSCSLKACPCPWFATAPLTCIGLSGDELAPSVGSAFPGGHGLACPCHPALPQVTARVIHGTTARKMLVSVLGASMASQPDKIQGAGVESLAGDAGSRPRCRALQSLLFLPSYLCSVLFPPQVRGWVLK